MNLQTQTRPATPDELKIIRGFLTGPRSLFDFKKPSGFLAAAAAAFGGALAGFAAGTAVSLVLYLLSKFIPGMLSAGSPPVVRFLLLSGSVLGALLFPVMLLRVSRRGFAERDRLLSRDLQDAQVEVMRVSCARVLCRPMGGEEDLFFVEVSGNKTLCLTGEYLNGVRRQKKFPNTSFEIIRAPFSRRVLSFQALGESFEAEEIFRDIDADRFDAPRDGDILDTAFENLGRGE